MKEEVMKEEVITKEGVLAHAKEIREALRGRRQHRITRSIGGYDTDVLIAANLIKDGRPTEEWTERYMGYPRNSQGASYYNKLAKKES